MTVSIGFDARYIRTDHHDGISRFSARIGSEMFRLAADEPRATVTFIISDAKQLKHLPEGSPYVLANSATHLGERLIARKLNRYGFDIVFSPMQTMGSRWRNYALALTVHDLIYYSHPIPPRQFTLIVRILWRIYHWTWWPQRHLLNRADCVIAVSETTKNLIVQHNLTHKRIEVVYNATDLCPLGEASHEISDESEKPALIYMGSFLPYKNVETLIEVANRLPEFRLLLLSKIDDRDRIRLAKLSNKGNVEFLNGVTDRRYREELNSAFALVSASLDEGFGIPVLEAMAMGTPVVCSRIPSFQEIGGDVPIYVDPLDAGNIVDAVRALSPTERERRSRAGIAMATHFSWRTSAQKLLDILIDLTTAKAPSKTQQRFRA
jgi:glycosyltransferase involved in cell wall biosynthesis